MLLPTIAFAQDLKRSPDEPARAFAERVIGPQAKGEDIHVLETKWNGRTVLFVDFPKDQDRELVALEALPGGAYNEIAVTTAEEEGGLADVAGIGFATLGHDAAQKLIVILAWPVEHMDVHGTLYEVRIFDDAKPNDAKLTYLKSLSSRFSANTCDCDRSGEKSEHYRFKTIASVKAELKRLGY